MPGRSWPTQTAADNTSAGTKPYRYGFNGKESDFEIKDIGGSSYDYGFRIYDPRLGRFLSVDPLFESYPALTPYQFASNRPIDGIDIDGLEYHQNSRPGEMVNGFLTPAKDNAAFALTEQQVLAALSKKVPPPPPPTNQFQNAAIGVGGVQATKEYQMFNYNAPVIVPGYGLAEAYGEYKKTGQVSYTNIGLGILSILPAKALGPIGKLIGKGGQYLLKGAGKLGKCKEFAGDFMKKMAPTLMENGATVTQKELQTFSYGIEQNGKSVGTNGYHTIVEIVKDSQTYIVDNLNPSSTGVLKEDFIKTLEVVDPVTGGLRKGEAAYSLFKEVKK